MRVQYLYNCTFQNALNQNCPEMKNLGDFASETRPLLLGVQD